MIPRACGWLAFARAGDAFASSRVRRPAPTDPESGKRLFEQFCSKCHGADGRGGERGPNIVDRLAFRNDRDLVALIHDGLPSAGMPGIVLPSATAASLVRFVRQLQAQEGPERPRLTLDTADGGSHPRHRAQSWR